MSSKGLVKTQRNMSDIERFKKLFKVKKPFEEEFLRQSAETYKM